MPIATNIYRRGAVYWWRRAVSWPIPGSHPETHALSLQTKGAGEARTA
jgi:hypothetical protein